MPRKHAFEFLTDADAGSTEFAIAALFGGDSTLTSWCASRLIGDADVAEFPGKGTRWSDVRDELATASLFDMGDSRTVVIRDADKFVSENRKELEAYFEKPSQTTRLVLMLDALASNTKVYKSLDKNHTLLCCSAETGKKSGVSAAVRRKFLTKFVASRHQAKLNDSAADALVEMIGDDCGFLDTEVAKLALYLQPGETITEPLVRDVVAGWQGKTIWQITEAIASGDAAEAIKQLDKLISGGQPAIALLPQIAWSLRRLGLATCAHLAAEQRGGRPRLEESLERAGVRSFEVSRVKADLKRMKRDKASKLLGWLLDADLRLKGTHSADGRDRFLLEQFVTRLARD
ncbi:MAG: DNA polymerase III subunit delta [Planctomycetota bacterium]